MTKGRQSIIKTYNLNNEIDNLRSKGLSVSEILMEVKGKYPEMNISHSTIGRYLRGETKSLKDIHTSSDLQETFHNMMVDIYFHIDRLESLNNKDAKAINKFLKSKQRWFNNRLKNIRDGVGESRTYLTYDGFNVFLIALCSSLCSDCANRVSTLAEQELKRRQS